MKDSATLEEFEKEKNIVSKLKNQQKLTKFHKSQIEITNEGSMLTNQCWNPTGNLYRYLG